MLLEAKFNVQAIVKETSKSALALNSWILKFFKGSEPSLRALSKHGLSFMSSQFGNSFVTPRNKQVGTNE